MHTVTIQFRLIFYCGVIVWGGEQSWRTFRGLLWCNCISHKDTTAACQLRQKQSRVQKLHMLVKRRWLAGSKECNLLDDLIGDFLNVGQKVCRLPRPSPSNIQQVKPKMEAVGWSVKEGNEKSHIFSMWDWKLFKRFYMRQSCIWVQNTTILQHRADPGFVK